MSDEITTRLENWGKYSAGNKVAVDRPDAMLIDGLIKKLPLRHRDMLLCTFSDRLAVDAACYYLKIPLRPATHFV